MEKEDKRRVIHVEMKATGKHRYFASPAAIYDVFSSQELGIARQSLLNYWQKRKNLMRILFALSERGSWNEKENETK